MDEYDEDLCQEEDDENVCLEEEDDTPCLDLYGMCSSDFM